MQAFDYDMNSNDDVNVDHHHDVDVDVDHQDDVDVDVDHQDDVDPHLGDEGEPVLVHDRLHLLPLPDALRLPRVLYSSIVHISHYRHYQQRWYTAGIIFKSRAISDSIWRPCVQTNHLKILFAWTRSKRR